MSIRSVEGVYEACAYDVRVKNEGHLISTDFGDGYKAAMAHVLWLLDHVDSCDLTKLQEISKERRTHVHDRD